MPIASIRFARTGSFAEAFNFSGIFETIGRIGWLNYIVAIILVGLVVGIPIMVLIFGFIIVAIIIGGVSMVLLKEAGLLVLLWPARPHAPRHPHRCPALRRIPGTLHDPGV